MDIYQIKRVLFLYSFFVPKMFHKILWNNFGTDFGTGFFPYI